MKAAINYRQQKIYETLESLFPTQSSGGNALPNIRSKFFNKSNNARYSTATFSVDKNKTPYQATATLPSESNQIFIAITDEPSVEISEFLTQLDAASESTRGYSVGYFNQLNNPDLEFMGWHGFFLVPTTKWLAEFPKEVSIRNETFHACLTILLSKSELDFGQANGIRALYKRIRHHRPGIFYQNNISAKPESSTSKPLIINYLEMPHGRPAENVQPQLNKKYESKNRPELKNKSEQKSEQKKEQSQKSTKPAREKFISKYRKPIDLDTKKPLEQLLDASGFDQDDQIDPNVHNTQSSKFNSESTIKEQSDDRSKKSQVVMPRFNFRFGRRKDSEKASFPVQPSTTKLATTNSAQKSRHSTPRLGKKPPHHDTHHDTHPYGFRLIIQIVGETIFGSLILTGGLIYTLNLLKSGQLHIACVSALISLAGGALLKDAVLSIKRVS